MIAQLAAPSPYVQASRAACAAELTRIGTTDRLAWRQAERLWRDAGDDHQAAYAQWRGAEALLAGDGARGEARDLARDAYGTAVRLGARPLADELRSSCPSWGCANRAEAAATAHRLGLTADRIDG